EEIDYLYQGGPKTHFPEAWNRFIDLVPVAKRKNTSDLLNFYFEKFHSSDSAEAARYANEWTLWEASVIALHYDPRKIEEDVFKENNIAIANLEAHYFINNCFLPKDYILNNLHKITHIPATVVQGRYDFCTPPYSAVDLAGAYGKNMSLHMVNNGHLRSEPESLASLRIYTEAVLE
ncbi:prolyl aminopeptidase, partial [Candidatus Microgenomates bacterium]|nr:prolyl aminopeptidase [Candidatus Microgenomates bacterium]